MRFRFLLLSSASVRPHVQSAKGSFFLQGYLARGTFSRSRLAMNWLIHYATWISAPWTQISIKVFFVSGQPYPFPKKKWNHPRSARMIIPNIPSQMNGMENIIPNSWVGDGEKGDGKSTTCSSRNAGKAGTWTKKNEKTRGKGIYAINGNSLYIVDTYWILLTQCSIDVKQNRVQH